MKASGLAKAGDSNPNPDCYESLAPYYEEIYANIDADETVRQWWQLLRESQIVTGHPERLRLLDIGCGPGWQLKAWRELGFAVSGVDSSPTLLALARERLGPLADCVDLYRANILEPASLPAGMSYDVVVSHFNFLNLFSPEQRERLFMSVASLVQPGGVWIADFAEPRSPLEAIEERISVSEGALVRKGEFNSRLGCFEQHWEGPAVACHERYWFGHGAQATALASRTGWQLCLRRAWHPYAPDAAWQDPKDYDEVLVDVYRRLKGGAT